MKRWCIRNFIYLTNLSASFIDVKTPRYLSWTGFYLKLGPRLMWCLRGLWLLPPQGSTWGPGAMRWFGICLSRQNPSSCIAAVQAVTGPSGCPQSGDVCMAKVFLSHSHQLCSGKLDVIKLIKPEIRSCNDYFIIKFQRWPHWYILCFCSDAEYIFLELTRVVWSPNTHKIFIYL